MYQALCSTLPNSPFNPFLRQRKYSPPLPETRGLTSISQQSGRRLGAGRGDPAGAAGRRPTSMGGGAEADTTLL